MIIPLLFHFLRPWLFLVCFVLPWAMTVLVVGIILLLTWWIWPPRDADGEPLNLEDLDA